jgi:hypothetical protein
LNNLINNVLFNQTNPFAGFEIIVGKLACGKERHHDGQWPYDALK